MPLAFAAQLSIAPQSAAPGASLIMPVDFLGQLDTVSGVQFDLQYDSSAMSLAVIVGDAARNSGKQLYMSDLGPGARRFLIVGLNQNPISEGPLINLFVNLRPDAPTGTYSLQFSNATATGPNGNPVAITAAGAAVTVQGSAGQGVPIQPAGVLSGGSLLRKPIAPGEIIVLMGSGIGPPAPPPTPPAPVPVLSGVSVLFDGTPAPLLYAAPNQINAIVPFEITGKTTTQMQLTSQGQTKAELSLPVVPATPALFTADSSGVGPGAILNQDSTLNTPSNPANPGSIISLFATGAGQTDPPGIDAQIAGDPLPKPVLPVSVQIGGVHADVLYAGAARGLVAGILQIDCRVPASVPSGYTVPVDLTVGTFTSPSGVTLAVK